MSEQVGLVMTMIGRLPASAQEELRIALRRSLHELPTPAERRVAELGFLAQLIRDHGRPVSADPQDGPLPDEAAEEIERRGKRWNVISRDWYDRERPPEAPDSRRLLEAYPGKWIDVCRAADGLLDDGRYAGVGKPWHTAIWHDMGRGSLYTRADCMRVLERCAREIGRVPSSADYIRWRASIVRRTARKDRKGLGLPTYEVFKDRYGGWNAVRQALHRHRR